MARVVTSGETVTLALTRVERLEGFRSDIVAPVASVRAVDDLWSELRGIRAPGTGIPRVIAVCTCRGSFGKDFAAVHGRAAGVVVEFDGEPFQRWVVTVDDPGRVAGELSAAAGLTGGA